MKYGINGYCNTTKNDATEDLLARGSSMMPLCLLKSPRSASFGSFTTIPLFHPVAISPLCPISLEEWAAEYMVFAVPLL